MDRTPRQATPEQRLLTIRQVSEIYGWPDSSVRDLIGRGLLPVLRLNDDGPNSRIWIPRKEVERLIAERTEIRR